MIDFVVDRLKIWDKPIKKEDSLELAATVQTFLLD